MATIIVIAAVAAVLVVVVLAILARRRRDSGSVDAGLDEISYSEVSSYKAEYPASHATKLSWIDEPVDRTESAASPASAGPSATDTTGDELRTLFSEVGEVDSCQLITDRDSGRSKGFGFIEMNSQDNANSANEKKGPPRRTERAPPEPQGPPGSQGPPGPLPQPNARPSASPPLRDSAPPPESASPSESPPSPEGPPRRESDVSLAEIREGREPDTARSAWRGPRSPRTGPREPFAGMSVDSHPGRRTDLEPVHLGASAPQSVRPGDHFSARFVAYVKAFEKEIEATLAKLSPRAERHLDIKQCRWQIGTPVKVRLYGNHFAVPQPEDSFIWEGQKNMLDFDVEIPQDAPQLVTVLKFDVLIDDIVIARLRLDLEIGSQKREEPRTVKGEPARSAFASYASKDRQRVLDRVAEIRRNGVDVFLDCLSLHPGEQWKPRLKAEIVSRELFMLFWSISAKQSEWVTWEWQTALQHRGLEGIDPHPLDPVDLASPPQELSDLHFGDPHMLIRAAYDRPTSQTD